MSIQLTLLKSGEEVIADIKEIRQEETDELVSYLFKDPYCVKIKTAQVLKEGKGSPKHEAIYYKWMSLSKDTDIIVNKDWIVCITDPIDTIKTSYEERVNGRRSRNDSDESSNRRDGGTSGSGSGGATKSDSSLTLNKSNNSDIGD